MIDDRDRRIRVAAALFAVIGLAVVASAVIAQGLPQPVWLLVVLLVAFVVLDNASVEMSEGLYLSSSAMVLFTAAVAFGRHQALAAVVLMGAGTLAQGDILRKGRRPVAIINTGQIVLSSATAIGLLSVLLPSEITGRGQVGPVVLAACAAAVVYPWVNFGLVSLLTRWFYPDRPHPRAAHQIGNNGALTVLGVLGGLLGAVYVLGGAVILPLLFITYLVGHLGFRVNAQVKEAHEATIRGLVRALEALDPYSRGHAERVAKFVALTARRLHLDIATRTKLRWAAYVHDIGKIAVPAETLRNPGPLSPSDQERMIRLMATVEEMLAEVDFLEPVIEIVRGRHAIVTGASQRMESVEARVLAAADIFDGLTSARSYRAAVMQNEAFGQLRRISRQLGGEVVEAFIEAVEASGEVYGSPDAASTAAVEHLVRERAIRA